MHTSPARLGAPALVLLAGFGLGYTVLSSVHAQTVDNPPVSVSSAPAVSSLQDPPVVSGASPSAGEQRLAEQMVHTDEQGRHLAPRGTFYLLSYVSVKTDKGVEGFTPGQEVKFVSADREKQTLVVGNGRAEIEVPVGKLTNDLDMAEMAKNNDEANQAKLATYAQQQLAAYRKYERETAEATAKDLEERKKQQAEQVQQIQQAQSAQQDSSAAQVYSSNNGGGYYNDGGYGYGSPYSYFVNNGAPINAQQPGTVAAPNNGTGNAGGSKSSNKVVRPSGTGGGGGPVGPAFAPSGNLGSGAPAANAGTSTSGSTSGGPARPPR